MLESPPHPRVYEPELASGQGSGTATLSSIAVTAPPTADSRQLSMLC